MFCEVQSILGFHKRNIQNQPIGNREGYRISNIQFKTKINEREQRAKKGKVCMRNLQLREHSAFKELKTLYNGKQKKKRKKEN